MFAQGERRIPPRVRVIGEKEGGSSCLVCLVREISATRLAAAAFDTSALLAHSISHFAAIIPVLRA
jgi:hypothetical protein